MTILFGRTQFTTVGGDCQPVSGAVDLDQVSADLATRHLTAVGTVVVDRTNESGFACWGRYALQPDWDWIEDAGTTRDGGSCRRAARTRT